MQKIKAVQNTFYSYLVQTIKRVCVCVCLCEYTYRKPERHVYVSPIYEYLFESVYTCVCVQFTAQAAFLLLVLLLLLCVNYTHDILQVLLFLFNLLSSVSVTVLLFLLPQQQFLFVFNSTHVYTYIHEFVCRRIYACILFALSLSLSVLLLQHSRIVLQNVC